MRVSQRIFGRLLLVAIAASGCRAELGALKINEAAGLYSRGEYAEALAVYDESIAMNPSFGWAHLGRGNCLEALGRMSDAVEAYGEAARLMPSNPEAHYWLGASLYENGRANEALAALREAIRLQPSDSRAHVTLGMALSVLGEHEQAVDAFRRGSAACGRCGLWPEAEERFRVSTRTLERRPATHTQ